MEISNLDMETRPSRKSFHYISASKNINFKNDNTIANVDSSSSNNNADNSVILQMNKQIFSTHNQAFTYRD